MNGNPSTAAWPNSIAKVSGSLVALLGVLVLLGWQANIGMFKSVLPGWVTMKPNAAFAFVWSGLALVLVTTAQRTAGLPVLNPSRRTMVRACATLVAAIGALSLIEYLAGRNLGIDQLLYAEPAGAVNTSNPGRMAPMTALNLTLFGAALWLADHPRYPRLFSALTGFVMLSGMLGAIDGLYDAALFERYTRMALHTALAFLLLGAGLHCVRRDAAAMEILVSEGAGGTLARQLLPTATCVPLLLGWLRLEAQHAGWVGTEVGTLLFALSNVVIFSTLTVTTAKAIQRADAVRKASLAAQMRLAAIVESSDDAIIGKTLEGIITSWNAGAEKVFGYSVAEAVGKPMLLVMPPDRAGEEPEILRRIARGEIIEHFETVRVRKDGRRIDVSATISPIKDEQGRIIGASKIARDISERKQADRKLQAHLERLKLLDQITRAIGDRLDLASIYQIVVRSLEESLPVDFACICTYDREHHSLTVSSVGVRSGALALRLALTEEANVPIDENGLSRCVRGTLVYEADVTEIAFPFPRRLASGGLRAVVFSPLRSESSVFGALVCARRADHSFSSGECEFIKQLSEHVALAAHQAQLHSSLRRAYDDLRQTQQAVMQQERMRALGQMASGIAHDINNAISPVALYTESLLETEGSLSPRARNYLETIQRAVDDVAQTVARMREFYRQRDALSTLAPVNVNRLLQQVLDLTRARWNDMPQQRGYVIEAKVDAASDLPTVRGAENEIREALTNLIFNAVDAMPDGGCLLLRTSLLPGVQNGGAHPPRVCIEVIDDGIGMDEDTRRRCFEPFFTTKGERGTGLGMGMVYGVMQRHNGEIEIDSAPGQGTTMRLIFPVTAANDSAAPDITRYEVPTRLRILLIDDDPVLLKSLSDTLETDGHQVVAANGGQHGIDTFEAALRNGQPFALAITDLGMPHIDGRRVASAIKKLSSSTPVIMLTGWGQRMAADNEVPPDVDQLLSKPPKLHDLRAAFARLCDRA